MAAVFIERCRADDLDLPARKGRLQDVGSVDAAFRRTCADDRVQFVDEQDGAAVLTQFCDGIRDALFKLAAVFRAREHRAKVERHDPLVLQQFRDPARGDALCKPFNDRAFAHARVADERGVVFRAAAEDLDHALDLRLPADDGVELTIARSARQVAAELVEHRRSLPCVGRFAGSLSGRTPAGEHGLQALHIRAKILQNAHGNGIPLPQDGKQDMLCADIPHFEGLCFIKAQFKDLLRARRIAEAVGEVIVAAADECVRPLRDGLLGHAEGGKRPVGSAFSLPDQAEEKMLAADIVVPHCPRSFLRKGQGALCALGASFQKAHMCFLSGDMY